MNQFTTEELDKLVSAGETVIVDFFTTWCGPCKMLAPIFESAASKGEGQAVFGKVDAEAELELAQRYGIMSVPTIILFKGGEIVKKHTGVLSETAILGLLE